MRIETFEMERMQSTWENVVEFDLSESGVLPVSLRELSEMGFDLDRILETPLSYSQSNGTPELRQALAEVYLGAEIHRDRTASFWGMSDRVIVTSGLSKAFGIPGVRIGWMVGPEAVVYDCWTQHDSLSICPSKLSDAVARFAVRPPIRDSLYSRGRELLRANLETIRAWVGELQLALNPPA